MKRILLLAVIALCICGCEKEDSSNYGYLRVINDLDVDVKLHAENSYRKQYVYDFVFPAHTDITEKMYHGGYNNIEQHGDSYQMNGIFSIQAGDTTLFNLHY